MAGIKNLAKQTAIYGVGNILRKFLNWCLVPFYTHVLASSAENGIITNLYAWMALILVILTYGMETGFFRYANKKEEDATVVYSSSLWCVAATSLLFVLLSLLFAGPVANLLGYDNHREYISLICLIVALDAFNAIPFASLRYRNKALRFTVINLLVVSVNIFFNIFFLVICPKLQQTAPETIGWFYNADYGVGYVFIANLISTISATLLLMPEIRKARFYVHFVLLKKILKYSLPLLLLGVAGIMNQTIDKIIFPFLLPDRAVADSQLGIYGTCFKVAMVMMVFTQAFRYAYEPFIFARNKGGDKRNEYADAMKFFVIFSLLIFLGIMFYLDILKYIIRQDYWEGLDIVPVTLLSFFFQGIFFNLSLWYKLIDKTKYGAYFTLIGLVITLILNILLVPLCYQFMGQGYWGAAIASFACYLTIMLISYYFGQKYYPIAYDLKSMGFYFGVAIGLYVISVVSPIEGWLRYLQNTILLAIYLILIVIFERRYWNKE